jgi:hypothetical protein
MGARFARKPEPLLDQAALRVTGSRLRPKGHTVEPRWSFPAEHFFGESGSIFQVGTEPTRPTKHAGLSQEAFGFPLGMLALEQEDQFLAAQEDLMPRERGVGWIERRALPEDLEDLCGGAWL